MNGLGTSRLSLNLSTKKVTEITVPKKEIRFVLPFIDKETNSVKTKRSMLVSEAFPFCKVIFVFQTGRALKVTIFHKDKIPLNIKSLVVYKFECGDCNVTYIGKTQTTLEGSNV